MIIEGATEKLPQFKMTLKSIHNKNFNLKEQEGIFEYCRKFKALQQSVKLNF